MTTETFIHKAAAGANIYFRVFDDVGQVFDVADKTFKLLSTATTPYIVATERIDMDGTSKSTYTAAINLDNLNNTAAVKRFFVHAYDNATPADTDAAVSGLADIVVQFGKPGRPEIRVRFGISTKTTAGTTVQASAWLECDGEVLDLATIDSGATADALIILHGQTSGMPTFQITTVEFGSVNTDNNFEREEPNTNLTADRQYSAIVTITVNGVAFVETFPFVVFP